MKFENKGKWIKEAEDKLAARDTMEDPDFLDGDDKVLTFEEEELDNVPSDKEFEEEQLDEDSLGEDSLDEPDEELTESLYVDPANYSKHNDLIDVVDKAGNPQKMTKATYDKNKGSGEFTVKEQPKEKESPKMTPKIFSAKNRDFSQYKKGQERFVADSFSAAALADASKEDLTKRVKELYDAGLSFDAVTSALSKEDIDHIYKTMDGFPNEYPEAERNRENLVYFMSKELEK